MLEEISIKDLGVIQSATLPFTKGLTVITGETGAGKTMVLTALSLLLGKRSDSNMVRNGCAFTSVEGCWNVAGLSVLPKIEEAGGVVEDGMLYMNRTVQSDGKSRAVVGGKTTPATILSEIGEGLVNIHGQSDQIRLKSVSAQREALDTFAGSELSVLKVYQSLYERWRYLDNQIKDIKNNMAARERELEELTFAVKEISKANPEPKEDERLRNDIDRLSNLEVLKDAAMISMSLIATEDYNSIDITSAINNVAKSLSDVAAFDEEMSKLAELAESIKINVDELSSGVSSYIDNIDVDGLTSLNEAQERLATLNSLIRKYGGNLDEVIAFWANAESRLEELNPENSDISKLESELEEVYNEMVSTASEVSAARKSAAIKLEAAVNAELAGLAMAGNKLVIQVEESESFSSHGKDDIAFLMLTPGASNPRPLNKSASGGELSRIMLSLEVVLADPTVTPTFVFDEVDSGVGGATAIEIGKRLSRLSRDAQVIVVTHLPQVAVFGDNHLRVLKTNSDSFVSTDVSQLDENERVGELTRMLSGMADSDSGQAHARELIDMANGFKATA